MRTPFAAVTQFGRRCVWEIGRRRFAVLFLFLLGSLVAYPYAEDSGVGYFVFRLLGSAIILLSVYAVSFRKGLVLLVLILALPALLHRVMLSPADTGMVPQSSRVLSLLFDVVVVTLAFRRVFSKGSADSETVLGALCIYLLIGYGFASVYGIIYSHQPHAFYLDPVTNIHAAPDRFDFIYFSFGTMTELGTAGMIAVAPVARSVSLLEAVIGILYLAVLIARLMSSYRPAAHAERVGIVPAKEKESPEGLSRATHDQ
jgi:hypothetical protein